MRPHRYTVAHDRAIGHATLAIFSSLGVKFVISCFTLHSSSSQLMPVLRW